MSGRYLNSSLGVKVIPFGESKIRTSISNQYSKKELKLHGSLQHVTKRVDNSSKEQK
jgi:hypothetical protein